MQWMLELLSAQVRFPDWQSKWRTPETGCVHCLGRSSGALDIAGKERQFAVAETLPRLSGHNQGMCRQDAELLRLCVCPLLRLMLILLLLVLLVLLVFHPTPISATACCSGADLDNLPPPRTGCRSDAGVLSDVDWTLVAATRFRLWHWLQYGQCRHELVLCSSSSDATHSTRSGSRLLPTCVTPLLSFQQLY